MYAVTNQGILVLLAVVVVVALMVVIDDNWKMDSAFLV